MATVLSNNDVPGTSMRHHTSSSQQPYQTGIAISIPLLSKVGLWRVGQHLPKPQLSEDRTKVIAQMCLFLQDRADFSRSKNGEGLLE